MGLDIRWPIGLMFGLIGVILTVVGLVNPVTRQSPDLNINLYWGLFLFVFGAIMTFFAYRGRDKGKNNNQPPPSA